MRVDLFQSCGHCWVFQICWHIECNTLIASSFRVLNSSTEISLHPLALLTAVLPKAHLTSYSRRSGSGWLTTPSWLSGSLRSFLYSSCMYSFHLFLISSTSTGLFRFCLLSCSSLGEVFPWHFQFSWSRLWSSLLLFPSVLCIVHWRPSCPSLLFFGTALSGVDLSLSPSPFASLLSSAICKASSGNHFAFLLFCFGGMVLFKISCTTLWTSVHSSSGTPFTSLFWPQLIFSKKLLIASCFLIHWEKLSCSSHLLRWFVRDVGVGCAQELKQGEEGKVGGKGEGFVFLNHVGDVTLFPRISASPMKLGHRKGRGQRKPRRQQHLNIFRCVWFEGLVSCVLYMRIVFAPLLIYMVWKRSFGGRVAFAVKCCGHSFGRKDADRPVVFWNHVQLYHQPHKVF